MGNKWILSTLSDTRDSVKKVSVSRSYIEPQKLPPTSAAAKYHSLRVYYQVQEWKGLCNQLAPTDWGWHIVDEMYVPLQTDIQPAPKSLLEVIRCACKRIAPPNAVHVANMDLSVPPLVVTDMGQVALILLGQT